MRGTVRGKLVLFTILLFLFLTFIAGKYFFLDQKNAQGYIKIISSPTSSVFIDNVATGKTTPYEEKKIIGEYLIKLIPEGEATSTASWQGKVAVFKNALTYVNRELGSSDVSSAGEIFWVTKMDSSAKNQNVGEIYIETEPVGAIVKLDNDEKGVAPLILTDVLTGTHEVNVWLPGFFPRTQKINAEARYRVNAKFKLAVDQSQKKEKVTEATESAKIKNEGSKVKIKDTPTGFLRVREEPTVVASEEAQVKPGETFSVLEEKSGWYRIEYEDGKEGWISGEYAEKIEQ